MAIGKTTCMHSSRWPMCILSCKISREAHGPFDMGEKMSSKVERIIE